MAKTDKKAKLLTFVYHAETEDGRKIVGKARAENSLQVRKALQKRGLSIQTITEEKSFMSRFTAGKISVKDRSIFYRELATMMKAGVSITQAIDVLADTPNAKMKKVLTEVSTSLQNGFPLSVALASHKKVFPTVELGVIKAGEATGKLSAVLLDLAESAGRSAEFSSRVRGAMLYPAFIIATLIIVGVVILIKVIPPIKDIFASVGTELPVSTKILLFITDTLVKGWGIILLIIIVLAFLTRLFARTKPGKKFFSFLTLNFPVFGQLNRQVFLARFNRTMTLLISAGVPILESVKIITDSTNNTIYRASLEAMAHALEQGAAISSAIQNNKYFPKLMTQLLYVGQQSGDLAGSTTTLAEFYEAEVDAKLRTFSTLLEPFIIVVLGAAVGFIILSVMQPIYSLSNVI